MATKKRLSAWKAKKMLQEGTARGRKITNRQRRYFGWVAGGKKQPRKRKVFRSR